MNDSLKSLADLGKALAIMAVFVMLLFGEIYALIRVLNFIAEALR